MADFEFTLQNSFERSDWLTSRTDVEPGDINDTVPGNLPEVAPEWRLPRQVVREVVLRPEDN